MSFVHPDSIVRVSLSFESLEEELKVSNVFVVLVRACHNPCYFFDVLSSHGTTRSHVRSNLDLADLC